MLRRQVALGVLLLVCCFGIPRPAAGQPTCPDAGDVYSQCPNFLGNGTASVPYAPSELSLDVSIADDFTLGGHRTIRRIRWWGTYLISGAGCGPPPASADDFTVFLWADAEGNPDGPEPLLIPPYTVTRLSDPVGQVGAGLGPAPVFEYELDFPDEGFHAPAGETFWLEVHNDLVAGCYWVWLTAPTLPGDGSSRRRWTDTDTDWSAPTTRGFDLAFSLAAGPVPAASEWGLVVMALLLLTAGTIISRRCTGTQAPACVCHSGSAGVDAAQSRPYSGSC